MDVAVRRTDGNSVAGDLGLKPKELAKVAQGLAGVMADTYLLYLKTQNFHWNVTGPMFGELHALFEQQYTDLAMAADELAERIRAIGEFAPSSFPQFRKLSKISDEESILPPERMIAAASADNEHVIRRMREVFEVTEQAGDVETGDILIRRMQYHAKQAWMLRSYLQRVDDKAKAA
ncbi:MAG TPA: DNA starvation/stationary phase protection protein [Stellaceae bacterium]|jgi:starvation-inducible DNA-binding protein